MMRSTEHQSLVDQLVQRGGIDGGVINDPEAFDVETPLSEVKFLQWQVFVGPSGFSGSEEDGLEVAALIEHNTFVDDEPLDQLKEIGKTLPEAMFIQVPPYERDTIWLMLMLQHDECDTSQTAALLDEFLGHAHSLYTRFGHYPNAPRIPLAPSL